MQRRSPVLQWGLPRTAILTAFALGVQLIFAAAGQTAWWWTAAVLIVAAFLLRWCRAPGSSAALNLVAASTTALFITFATGEFFVVVGRPPLAFGAISLAMLAIVIALVLQFATNGPPRAPSRLATLAMRTTLVLGALSVAAWLTELGFRSVRPASIYHVLTDRVTPGRLCVRDPERGITRLCPGFKGHYIHSEFRGLEVQINELGLRDGLDETAPPAADAVSVLVLGDSFVFGTGVRLHETFHERLEARATEITDRPLRVFGAGVPGYGQREALDLYGLLADRVRPQVVVQAIYEGNDVRDNLLAERRRPPTLSADTTCRLSVPALRHGRRMLNARFWRGSSATIQSLGPALRPALERLGVIQPMAPIDRFPQVILETPLGTLVDRGVETTIGLLGGLRTRCQADGAALLVLTLPARFQADPRVFDQYRTTCKERPNRLDRRAFHDHLVARLRGQHYSVVDPMDALEASAGAERSCYHVEGHFNARGHAVTAEVLVPALRGLLRKP